MTKEELLSILQSYGGDLGYFTFHYNRLQKTLELFERDSKNNPGAVVLDVGAHWCHQALLWARSGYKVIAVDLANPLAYPPVEALCSDHGIQRIVYNSLENPIELDVLPNSIVDVVLFTEIIEHLTFNPVAFWRQIYRLMKPGGRIILSTPNFYHLAGRPLKRAFRFLRGDGAGMFVQDILERHTTNPHWKEYSKRELTKYFALLSSDFVLRKAFFISGYYPPPKEIAFPGPLIISLEPFVPWLRQNLHVEVELTEKRHGIGITPQWK